jgi:hypothetical protein
MATTAQQLATIVDLLHGMDERISKLESKPRTKVAERVTSVEKVNPYARVGCAYGGCKARFLPNGVGPLQHSTCKKGRAAMKAARA